MLQKIPLIDRYIINQLIPSLIFALAICTILGELIGITFEQVRFVTNDSLPIAIAARVHYLKLPAFISLGLPFALLMATIITYGQLSAKSEIVALQSFGVSLYRLLVPTIAIALFMAIIMFVFQEFVVPPANYQAAMILEKEWGVDRTQLAKYNKREIIYQQFEIDKPKTSLKFLFFANRFDGKQMLDVTLLKYQNQKLREIVISQTARWNEQKQLWQLFFGRRVTLNSHGDYAQTKNFEELPYKLTKNILDYANHHRDKREMNIIELYRRLEIIKNTANLKKIRQLKISIQERYALPFSCLVFSFLGCTLGTAVNTKTKSNCFGIATLAIFAYYSSQFLSTSLSVAGIITTFWGVWLPNLLGLAIGCYLLKYRCNF